GRIHAIIAAIPPAVPSHARWPFASLIIVDAIVISHPFRPQIIIGGGDRARDGDPTPEWEALAGKAAVGAGQRIDHLRVDLAIGEKRRLGELNQPGVSIR